MASVVPSRIVGCFLATAVVAVAGLAANACSLNPQPLPPDQPTDAGGLVNAPTRAGDSGGSGAQSSGTDATTGSTDSGAALGPEDSAAPGPEADAGSDTGKSGGGNGGDGGGGDGGEGGEGGVDGANGDAADSGPTDAAQSDGLNTEAAVDSDAADGCSLPCSPADADADGD